MEAKSKPCNRQSNLRSTGTRNLTNGWLSPTECISLPLGQWKWWLLPNRTA